MEIVKKICLILFIDPLEPMRPGHNLPCSTLKHVGRAAPHGTAEVHQAANLQARLPSTFECDARCLVWHMLRVAHVKGCTCSHTGRFRGKRIRIYSLEFFLHETVVPIHENLIVLESRTHGISISSRMILLPVPTTFPASWNNLREANSSLVGPCKVNQTSSSTLGKINGA